MGEEEIFIAIFGSQLVQEEIVWEFWTWSNQVLVWQA